MNRLLPAAIWQCTHEVTSLAEVQGCRFRAQPAATLFQRPALAESCNQTASRGNLRRLNEIVT